jgi:fructosamine-3-kinase
MQNNLKQAIQTIISKEITTITPLSGGMISDVVKIDFNNRQPLVAKLSHDSHDLTIEAYMLQYLKSHSDLPIPNVVHAEEQLLLIDYIDGHIGLNQPIQSDLGKMLGYLHQNTSTHYGLERDTLAGPLHQPNPQSDSWIEFFRDQRLLYMADIALKSGNLSMNIYNRLQKLAEKIDHYIIEPPAPVLIHGDMWTSNILVNNNQVVGIIDPSIYYAHNEMELAYMTLFDTVGQSFFDSYQQIIPVEQTFFDIRQHIYGLYPLLVHVKIFGGKYANSVDATLSKFGF